MNPADDGARRIASIVRPRGSVTAVEPLARGRRKRTVIVRFSGADPIVIQRSADGRAVRTEAAVLDGLADTAVPVPPVLGSGTFEGEAWLAVSFVDGDDLHERFLELSSDRRHRLVAAFGRYLAVVHETFRFERHGPLDVVDDQLVVTPRERGGDATVVPTREGADDATYLCAYGSAHATRLPTPFDVFCPRLTEVLNAAPPAADARLFPWDLRPGNALVSHGEVTAVLDWEAPLAADPGLAVAKAEYLTADWYRPERSAADLRTAFREGYRSVRPLPTVEAAHRVAAVVSSAVDSAGDVTNPGYPPVDREAAVAFHREALERALDGEA